MKVVINTCYGGFGLSTVAKYYMLKLQGKTTLEHLDLDDRTDPDLVSTVEALGDSANTRYSKLKVVEIPDDVKWEISDYDGIESIHEIHSSWN